ncbi:MAG: hypothetical protein CMG00_07570 [Candidatus Marinimicrobia bacterium]|nr:hypothetical protein [Candidatus Neomarinimicrobiota bacterium]|tara:strand:+ start:170 stop:1024 length:855 start_codon:yes stop_codon:yes gene_type:complete
MYFDDNVNYYDVLGLDNKASQDDIKKAFRKLSLQYHPDRDTGDNEKFKNITVAYEVLSNIEKRKVYDMESSFAFKNINTMHFNNDDLINLIFKNDNNDFHNILHRRKDAASKKPNIISKTIRINMEQAYNGCILPLLIERKNNKTLESETIYVTIPKGIDNNEFITIQKKGNIVDEEQGDIKVIVLIDNDSIYKRSGIDLEYTHNVTLKEALCGCNFEIKHISGKVLKFSNNSGNIINPSFTKTINGYGFIRDNHTGNFIISFNLIFPKSLTEKQIFELNKILT